MLTAWAYPVWTRLSRHAAVAVAPAAWLGAALLAVSYSCACVCPAQQTHFHLFWLGMAIFLVPGCLLLVRGAHGSGALLVVVAVFDSLPKFLRSPDHLVFYDELAHYRETVSILANARLFNATPTVPIVRSFPGLHTLAALLAMFGGLDVFQVAMVLLAAFHVLTVLGVYSLAGVMGYEPRVAAVAAFLYTLNPGFLYFDAQFAYESLALVFFLWALVCLAHVEHATTRGAQLRWLLLSSILASGCTITHHVTSYLLEICALLLAAASTLLSRRRHAVSCVMLCYWLFAVLLAAELVCWTIFVGGAVGGYLGPLARAWVTNAWHLAATRSPQRALFVASSTPQYERYAAFLSPFLLGIGAVYGGSMLKDHVLRQRACGWMLITLGLSFFVLLPLIVTPSGSEATRRSWSFAFVGLAFLVAPALVRLIGGHGSRPLHRIRTAIGLAAVVIVAVGDCAMNTNELYRFPGPVVVGSDARPLDNELLTSVSWFRAHVGPGKPVIADRDDAMAFAAFAQAWTATAWTGFPVWSLFLSTAAPSPALLEGMKAGGFTYLILDARITEALPRIGYYLAPSEPARRRPPPPAALTKFEQLPWASCIYRTEHLSIYRLDLSSRGRTAITPRHTPAVVNGPALPGARPGSADSPGTRP